MELRLGHTTGRHCGSTTLSDLSGFYGWGTSEPECFGIGAGLGFTYLRGEDSPRRQFVGRTPWLEPAFFDHLGVEYREDRGEDFETAWATVRRDLDAGFPVVLFVDIYYLGYFDSDVHFSPHVVLAVGYDDDHVRIADSEFDAVQRLHLSELREAWGSDVGFYGPLDNRSLTVTEPSVTSDPEDAYRAGLRRTAEAMLAPEDYFETPGVDGLDGIRTFADELPAWTDLPDATWCLRFAYQNVEKRGTGGGAFRGLFAPFVADAVDAGVLPSSFAVRADALAADWSTLGRAIKRAGLADGAAERASALDDASDCARRIADEEEAFYDDLLATL